MSPALSEKRFWAAGVSVLIPTTSAPSAWNSSIASRNPRASVVHPEVSAMGKK